MRISRLLLLLLCISFVTVNAFAQGSASVVKVHSGESLYKIKKGAAARISVVIQIDSGYHINSNRPADKNLIATVLKLERATGLTPTPVLYPKAKMRKFAFSPKPLSVYEGKAELRLSVRAQAAAAAGPQTIRGKLTVQACNDEACLRPQTIDVSIPVEIF
jgi:hypothetical protein